jgi:glycosyltransferase involved in cell wall biosynthesis
MITVLLPIYNGIEFIDESVSSVFHQTYTDWNLIIGVNGHPADSVVFQTAKQYESEKICVLDMPHIHDKSDALNEMVKYAMTPFVALLDVDDVWLSDKLETQSAFLAEYDVVGTRCVYFGDRFNGVVPEIPVKDISEHDFYRVNPVINSSAVIRKEYGVWDGSLRGVEDYDLWLRLRNENRRFYNCEEILVKHRLHPASAFNHTNADNVPAVLRKHERYRIRVFSSFCSSDNCKSVYERLCNVDQMANYGPDKQIYIVREGEPYTHAILMNTAMPVLTVPNTNVVGLAFEPPNFLTNRREWSKFVEYAKQNIHKYCIGDAVNLPKPFIESYSYMWHITPPCTVPEKNRIMSIMVSEKTFVSGHIYRHCLVQEILKTSLPIDIYGRGCRYYSNDARLKGEFRDDEPYEHYTFHICIENFETARYVSEKYTNPLLWGTVPIYLGAREVPFPEETIRLTQNIEEDMGILFDIIQSPQKYKKEISWEGVRQKVNVLKNLGELFR